MRLVVFAVTRPHYPSIWDTVWPSRIPNDWPEWSAPRECPARSQARPASPIIRRNRQSRVRRNLLPPRPTRLLRRPHCFGVASRTFWPKPLHNPIGVGADVLSDFTFPDHLHPPACRPEVLKVPLIACHVLGKLGRPEFCSGRWRGGVSAAGVPMPKTSVNHEHCLVSRQHDVRSTREVRTMKPEPQTLRMESTAKPALGQCVLAADTRHHPASRLLIHNVSQVTFS